MVRKKGDNASRKFIECLQSKDNTLFCKLQLVTDIEPQPSIPAASDQWIIPCRLEDYQRIVNSEANQIYPIVDKNKRQRFALIINNTTFEHLNKRNGAEVDQTEMKKLLEGLGYEVKLHKDLNSQKMEEALENFAKKQDRETTDSTVIVIMSHGVRDGICGVKSKEGKDDILKVDTIFKLFNAKNCTALREKPKVILIQACRGENKGHVWVPDSATPDDVNSGTVLPYENDDVKVHIESDFICFYSSTPDNVSWRHPHTGSVFIQKLIEVIRTQAWEHHIEELFRRVQHSFIKFPIQMPTKERTTLIKKFYLFPEV
ncbi:caspase-1-like isoform X2 [Protopterus annectens]|nr:caspase-1-like isoform X2 [Protopterus annectens]